MSLSSEDIAIQQKFNLPASERIIVTYHCALWQKMLIQGKMIITQNHLVFQSIKLSPVKVNLIIERSEICGVVLAKSLGVFNNSIKVFTIQNEFWFGSFLHRDQAYQSINQLKDGLSDQSLDQSIDQSNNHSINQSEDDMDEEQTVKQSNKHSIRQANRLKAAARAQRAAMDEDEHSVNQSNNQSNNKITIRLDNDSPEEEPRPRRTPVKQSNKQSNNQSVSRRSKQPVLQTEHQSDDEQSVDQAVKRSTNQPGEQDDDINEDDEIIQRLKAAKRAQSNKQSNKQSNNQLIVPTKQSIKQSNRQSKKKALDFSDDELDEDELDDDNQSSKQSNNQTIDQAVNQSINPTVYQYPVMLSQFDPAVEKIHHSMKKQLFCSQNQPKSNNQSNSQFSILIPGRRLLNSGFLDRQGGWSTVQRWCHLFSDLFLFTRLIDPVSQAVVIKQSVPLEGLIIDARPVKFQVSQTNSLPNNQSIKRLKSTKLKEPFRLIYTPPDRSNNQSNSQSFDLWFPNPVEYVVAAPDQSNRAEWLLKFELAISAYHYNQSIGQSTLQSKRIHQSNKQFEFGWNYHFVLGTPHQAVFDGDVELLDELINESINQSINQSKHTTLPINQSNNQTIKQTIDQTDLEGRPLLNIAAKVKNSMMVSYLLYRGARRVTTDNCGWNCVHVAASNLDMDCLTVILDQSDNQSNNLWKQQLINPSNQTNNPSSPQSIHKSTDQSNDHLVDFQDYHPHNKFPLTVTSALWVCALTPRDQSINQTNNQTTDPLLDELNDPSTHEPVNQTIKQSTWQECFTLLLSLCPINQRIKALNQIDSDGKTLIENAARNGRTDVCQFLRQQGVDIDRSVRNNGDTLLSLAVKEANMMMIETLVKSGAQVNRKSGKMLDTPLLVLNFSKSPEIAKYLCEVGARTSVKNRAGARLVDTLTPDVQKSLATFEVTHNQRQSFDTTAPMRSNTQRQGDDECCGCGVEFSLQHKREWCRHCSQSFCSACSARKLIFKRARADGKKERVLARVCDGCYNLEAFIQSPDGFRVAANRKRRESMSKSRRGDEWQDDEEDDNQTNNQSTNQTTNQTNDDSPVEDVPTLKSGLRAGLKGLRTGVKGAMKVGGMIGDKLTNVFDHVSDNLSQIAMPKDANNGANNHSTNRRKDTQEDDHDEGNDSDESLHSNYSNQSNRSNRSINQSTNQRSRPTSNANTSAAQARQSALCARTQAAANLQQMHEMGDKAAGISSEAQGFGSMAQQLKARAKSGRL